MLCTFLGALDQTIVAVSMPAISSQLSDVDLLAWVIAGYMVAMTVATPIYGKLGDLYGRRRILTIGMAIFTLSSLFCGLAQSMEQLVLARILQGIGAGGMVSVSQAIIGDIVAPRERGRYQGYFSSMYALASVAGPVLGGYLTQYLSWRWIFLLNLPIGLFACVYAHRTLAHLPTPTRRSVIDYLGGALMIAGLGTLLMAITLLGQGHAWHETTLVLLLVAGVVALGVFVRHEGRTAEPLLPMHLFADRATVMCYLTLFFTSFQIISLSMLVPLRLQAVTGAGADSAALLVLPLAMGVPIGAFFSGRHTAHSGRYKPIILAGTVLMPLAIAGIALTPVDSRWLSGLFLLTCGIAGGMQFPTSLVGAQNSVAARDIGVVTSTASLFRSLGGAVGVACMSAVLMTLLQHSSLAQVGHIDLEHSGNVLLHSLNASAGEAGARLRAELGLSFRTLLLISAAISLLGLLAGLMLPNRILRSRDQAPA